MDIDHKYKEYLIALTKTIVIDNIECFKKNKNSYEKFVESDESSVFKDEFVEYPLLQSYEKIDIIVQTRYIL